MKKKHIFLFLLLLMTGLFLNSRYAMAEKHQYKKVLFISSYSYDWSSIPMQLRGINKELTDSVDIDYLFMDTKTVLRTWLLMSW